MKLVELGGDVVGVVRRRGRGNVSLLFVAAQLLLLLLLVISRNLVGQALFLFVTSRNLVGQALLLLVTSRNLLGQALLSRLAVVLAVVVLLAELGTAGLLLLVALIGLLHEGRVFLILFQGVAVLLLLLLMLLLLRPVVVPLVFAVLAVRYIIRLGDQFINMAF